MPSIVSILIAIIAAVISVQKIKNQQQKKTTGQAHTPYAQPGAYLPPAQPPAPRFDTQTGKPLVGQPSAYGVPDTAHLCDDGQHEESDRDYAATLRELEPGYRAYQGGFSGGPARILRMRPLSAEERNKKKEELRDLLAAGIVSQTEYKDQMRLLG